nr:DegT/DnrJ/EryC1/StrS family aminotransferase [Mesorhizobium mediterraneum]
MLCFNARAAIWHGLHAIGLQRGDRILMPAYHCGSEVDVVMKAGMEPVFYPLDRGLKADLEQVRSLAQTGCAAIYGIDYFGYPQPEEVAAIARPLGLKVITDMALGLYSADGSGAANGIASDMAVFSLVKSLAVPEGGILYLDEQWRGLLPGTLARPPLLRSLAAMKPLLLSRLRLRAVAPPVHGGDDGNDEWDPHAMFARNHAEWSASRFGDALLARSDHERNARVRRRNYDLLHEGLRDGGANRPLLPPRPNQACPAFFPLWSDDPEAAVRLARGAGIEAVRFWRRPHPSVDLDPFPFAKALRQHVIRLPVHPDITADDIDRMADLFAGKRS